MKTCTVCGNDYEKAFDIVVGDRTRTFDCFECAIFALAPRCAHCGCIVIGHGIEKGATIFCCDHCASMTKPMQNKSTQLETLAP